MTLTVYFPSLPMPNTLDELRPLVPADVRLYAAPADEQPVAADVIVGGAVTEEQLARSPHLRAVIVPFAGIPFPTQALLRRYPAITLHNLHFNAISTAEMAFALLLAAAKHVAELDHRIRQGNWTWNDVTHPTDTFPGKTAVILGYGAIGKRLAPLCQALGMQVIGVRRHEPDVPGRDGVAIYSVAHLAELLPRADVLICLLPHTRNRGSAGHAGAGAAAAQLCLSQRGPGACDRRGGVVRRLGRAPDSCRRNRRLVPIPQG